MVLGNFARWILIQHVKIDLGHMLTHKKKPWTYGPGQKCVVIHYKSSFSSFTPMSSKNLDCRTFGFSRRRFLIWIQGLDQFFALILRLTLKFLHNGPLGSYWSFNPIILTVAVGCLNFMHLFKSSTTLCIHSQVCIAFGFNEALLNFHSLSRYLLQNKKILSF